MCVSENELYFNILNVIENAIYEKKNWRIYLKIIILAIFWGLWAIKARVENLPSASKILFFFLFILLSMFSANKNLIFKWS